MSMAAHSNSSRTETGPDRDLAADPWDRVAVVVVIHHSRAVIGSCLDAVQRCRQIIVVDNASDDDGVSIVRRVAPQAEIIENRIGVGYGNGANQGLSRVDREFVLLVNPDAVVLPGAVETLVAMADRYPEAGLLAPLVMNPDGSIEPSYDVRLFDRGRYGDRKRDTMPVPDGDLCAEFVSGAVVMVRMQALRRIGGFDPRFFLYFDDDDMCMALRAAGYSVLLTPLARVTHVGGGSVRPSLHYRWEKFWHLAWSRLHFEAKYRGSAAARQLALAKTLRHGAKALGYCFANWQKAWRDAASCAGSVAYLLGLPANRPEQRHPGPRA